MTGMMFGLHMMLAAIELVSPGNDQVVALVPDCQRAMLTNRTLSARMAALKADNKSGKALRHVKEWRMSKPIVFEWRATDGEKGPWMVAPGNHDLGNNATRENLDRSRRIFGRDREVRDVKGWRIIAGNSQFWHPTELKDEQAAYEKWLQDELEKASACRDRVILAMHIPPFAFTCDEKGSYDNCPTSMRMKRLESYVESGVRFVLAAHQHRFVVRGYKDLTILTGEAMSDNFDLRPQGFRLFEVRDDFLYSYRLMEV